MLTTIIISFGCFFVIVFLIIVFGYPQLLAKAGKFLFRTIRGQPALKPEQEEAKAKAKKLTPYMVLASHIEQLIPGQTLRYKIPETWGGNFITVELNPQYPQKGRKYILSIEKMANGLPGGEKTIMYDSDKSIDLAASIKDRNGELFVIAEETPANSEKVPAAQK